MKAFPDEFEAHFREGRCPQGQCPVSNPTLRLEPVAAD
jgi:hypothetical protein